MPSGCDQTHTHTSRQACSYRAACTLLHTGTHTKPLMKELRCYFLNCDLMRNLDFPLSSHSLFPCPLSFLIPFFVPSLSFSSSSLHFPFSSFHPSLCCYLTSLLLLSFGPCPTILPFTSLLPFFFFIMNPSITFLFSYILIIPSFHSPVLPSPGPFSLNSVFTQSISLIFFSFSSFSISVLPKTVTFLNLNDCNQIKHIIELSC